MRGIEFIRKRVEEVGHLQRVQRETITEEREEDHPGILVHALNLIDKDEDLEMNESGNIQEINIMIEIIDIEMTQGHVNIEETAKTVVIVPYTGNDKRRD